MKPTSYSIWLFLVTKFIYLLSKGGPVSRWNCYCTFFFLFFFFPKHFNLSFIRLILGTAHILSGCCGGQQQTKQVPQTTYGTANWMAGTMESGLPNHQQPTAELGYPGGQLRSQGPDLCILWSPNLHTWLLVKQALRTISPAAFRCLESQTGISVIPQSFYLCL